MKTQSACGDGVLDPGEECDTTVGDQTCQSLGHYNWLGQLSCRSDCLLDRTGCGGRCGDNLIDDDQGEVCDNSNMNGNSCQLLGYHGGDLACQQDCQGFDDSDCVTTGRCGDGLLQEDFEACDGVELGGNTCLDLGFYRGSLACAGNCTFDTSGCAESCGDGLVQTGYGEVCDGSNLLESTCGSLGYHGGTLDCQGDCQAFDVSDCEAVGRCGDDTIQAGYGEECDGAALGGNTCESLGLRAGVLACAANCIFDITGCGGTCGDGIIQTEAGETCDGVALDGQTCQDQGYYGGVLACASSCAFDLTACAAVGRCGDDVVQTTFGEDCDGTAMGGNTCQVLGFYAGSLVCDSNCDLDSTGCSLRCGDGIIQTVHGEDCDGTALGGATCLASFNKRFGLPACAGTCDLANGTCTNTIQRGTVSNDFALDITRDGSGNLYVTGATANALDGQTHAGGLDAFLSKFTPEGALLWTRQFGSAANDAGRTVAFDASGNVYVTGYVAGPLHGQTHAGGDDIFLVKFDTDGTRLWTRQVGNSNANSGQGVVVDSTGIVYVAGWTVGALDGQTSAGQTDAFLLRFTAAGTLQWTRQWGSAGTDDGYGVAIDSMDAIYVVGATSAALDGQTHVGDEDIFVTKFTNTGNKLYTVQWGSTAREVGSRIRVDTGGNIYVTGITSGAFDSQTNPSPGSASVFLTKYNGSATRVWSRILGSTSYDYSGSLAIASDGGIHLVFGAGGAVDGVASAGNKDAAWVRFDASGTRSTPVLWGGTGSELVYGVTLDAANRPIICGETSLRVENQTQVGLIDLFFTYLP